MAWRAASIRPAIAGAISAKGKTVAVFGTGVDVIYPKENSRLSEQILALGGALISEFPLGTFAAPQNFPIRNRIISGMSVGVLVVEAAEYSGTRITARCALEQNRDVFAVPGNVTNKNSWGPNTLIKQGAKLVATWEDVWEDLPTEVRLALTPPASPESPRRLRRISIPGRRAPSSRKANPEPAESRRSHAHRRNRREAGKRIVVLRNLRRPVRTGTGRQSQADAGEEFCKKLLKLSAVSFSAFSLTDGGGCMQDFKNLKVWEKAHRLTLDVYQVNADLPTEEMYGLTSQMRRASASIGANIAEGCGRRGDDEISTRFLQIACGSASELEYHLLLARDLEFC